MKVFFILQKTALSLVKSGLALGSPGCLVVWLFVCHHAKNGSIHRKRVVDCSLAITCIGETLFQTRPGKRNNWSMAGSSQSFTQLTLGLVGTKNHPLSEHFLQDIGSRIMEAPPTLNFSEPKVCRILLTKFLHFGSLVILHLMRNSGPPGCCRKYRDQEVTFFSRGYKTTLKNLTNVDFDTTSQVIIFVIALSPAQFP